MTKKDEDAPSALTAIRREVYVYKSGGLVGHGWFNIYYVNAKERRSVPTLVDFHGAQLEPSEYELEWKSDMLIVLPMRVQ